MATKSGPGGTYVRTHINIYESVMSGMLLDPRVGALVEVIALRGLEAARDEAAAFANTGAYLESLRVWHAHLDGATWEASYGSTSSVWHLVEFGTATNPPYAPLTRSLDRISWT